MLDTEDYRADDRQKGEDQPGQPDLPALRNLWDARDDLYVGRTLKPEAIEAVRRFREQEALRLPNRGQQIAGVATASAWRPPR